MSVSFRRIHRSPLSQLAKLILGEECYSSLLGFGLPCAYKLWQVLGEPWRFLLERLLAGGLKRKPKGLQERRAGVGFSSSRGGCKVTDRPPDSLLWCLPSKGEEPELNRLEFLHARAMRQAPHCLWAMVRQNMGQEGFSRPPLGSQAQRVLGQISILG